MIRPNASSRDVLLVALVARRILISEESKSIRGGKIQNDRDDFKVNQSAVAKFKMTVMTFCRIFSRAAPKEEGGVQDLK